MNQLMAMLVRPRNFLFFFVILSGILWTILPTFFYRVLPLDTAEAVMWGQAMEWGNCKHPPFSGFLAYWFSWLFGHAEISFYLLSQLLMALGFIYLYRLGREFFDETKSVMAALLITFFFLYNWETPKFNANIPHLALWPMTAFYFYRGVRRNSLSDWLLTGLCAGLAMLSKYISVFLLLALFTYLVSDRKLHKYFFRPEPYLALLVFALVLYPHVKWLIANDFLPFTYVDTFLIRRDNYFVGLFKTVGVIVGPFCCFLVAIYLVKWLSGGGRKITMPQVADREAARYAWFLFGVPAAGVVLTALIGKRVDTMWTYQLFIFAGLLIMAYYHGEVTPRSFGIFARLVVAFALLVLVIYAIYSLTVSKMRRHLDARELVACAQNVYRELEPAAEIPPLLFGDMWLAAQLQYEFNYQIPVCVENDPADLRRLASLLKEKGALIVSTRPQNSTLILQNEFNITPAWQKFSIPFQAPLGRKRYYTLYFAPIAPHAGQ